MYVGALRIGDDKMTTTRRRTSWHTLWFICWNRYAIIRWLKYSKCRLVSYYW